MNAPLKQFAKAVLRQTVYRNAVLHPRREQLPFLVRLDVTNTCNQACVKCFYPAYAKSGVPAQTIGVEEFERIARQVFPYTYYLQIACVFESLTHPKIAQLVEIIDRYAIPAVGMVTNGSLLRGEKAEALAASTGIGVLAVSLDGIDPETYRHMRGRPHLKQVLENVAAFQELKRARGKATPAVKFNTILARTNLQDAPGIVEEAARLGVEEIEFFHIEPIETANEESLITTPEAWAAMHDELGRLAAARGIRVFLPPPFSPEHGNVDPATGAWTVRVCQDIERSEFDTSGNDAEDGRYGHPYPRGTFCICPWMTLNIDAWGNVYPCTHRTNLPPIGNLVRQDLGEVLNSMRAMKLRESLLSGKLEGPCATCVAKTPNADPMKRRALRLLDELPTEPSAH